MRRLDPLTEFPATNTHIVALGTLLNGIEKSGNFV